MKRPQISIKTVMAVVFLVAVDCVVIRSIRIRPPVLVGLLDVIAFETLPMANILALAMTLLVERRGKGRSFRLGFVVCGTIALIATVVGQQPFLFYLERILQSTDVGRWLARSPARARVVAYVVLPAVALLFQLLAALAGGWLCRRSLVGAATVSVEGSRRRLPQGASLVLLLILIGAPAVIVEGILRWRIDSMTSRFPVGAVAVLDVQVMSGWRAPLQDGSAVLVPNGTRVRIDDDSLPSVYAGIRTPDGEIFGDHRAVQVTLLDGERKGESTSVPMQILRARR